LLQVKCNSCWFNMVSINLQIAKSWKWWKILIFQILKNSFQKEFTFSKQDFKGSLSTTKILTENLTWMSTNWPFTLKKNFRNILILWLPKIAVQLLHGQWNTIREDTLTLKLYQKQLIGEHLAKLVLSKIKDNVEVAGHFLPQVPWNLIGQFSKT